MSIFSTLKAFVAPPRKAYHPMAEASLFAVKRYHLSHNAAAAVDEARLSSDDAERQVLDALHDILTEDYKAWDRALTLATRCGGSLHPADADYHAVENALDEAERAHQRFLDFSAENKNRMPSLMRSA